MRDPLLARLSARPGRRVSGTVLARALELTRSAVHKRVARLREGGYRIDGASRLGYRLEASPDRLDREGLLGGGITEVVLFESLGSTQDEAKSRAARGAPEGTLIVAERQTAGRGRLGRSWDSPAGGLWFSLILRPPHLPERVPALTLIAALEWAKLLEKHGVPARLKWPNDLWVEGKKLAGLLTEMSAETDRVHWVALGVGMNVLNDAPRGTAIPAVSLKDILPSPPSRQELLSAWLKEFFASRKTYFRRGFAAFQKDYERRLLLRGRRVTFLSDAGPRSGRVTGVDGEGRLLLDTPRGPVAVSGGEVSLIRLNSR